MRSPSPRSRVEVRGSSRSAASASRSARPRAPGRARRSGEGTLGAVAGGARAATLPLTSMCGIVGYAGAPAAPRARRRRSRACGGWSTAATTRPASPCWTRPASWSPAKQAGKLANLEEPLDAEPAAAGHTGMGHTRWATHGAPNDRNAHPHVGGDGRPVAARPQRHHRELRRAARPSCESRGVELRVRDRHRGRRAPAGRARSTRRGDLHARRCARSAAGWRAPSPCSPSTPTSPASSSAPAATPRWSSDVGEGENFLGSDVAAFIEHTRDAIELGPGPGRRDHAATRSTVTDFDGRPAQAQGVPRRLGRLGRREGRLRPSWPRRSTSSRRPSPTRCWAASTPTAA